ncbi:MAG: SDR family NAD(P)-dependent oxidoreductase [Cellvibrionales bacterium]|nr:SDR family NAD(P)-dependent oxidoreductase [Cellvibrionales bacterium]
MFSLKGKTVLITGANRGIGEGFVRAFAEQGAKKIYVCARDLSNLDELVNTFGNILQPLHLVLEDYSTIDSVVSKVDELDVLINNAGIISMTTCSSPDALELLESEMRVNLYGPVKLTNALMPTLKQSQEAAIINVSSIAGMANFPSIGTYSMTKAAMNSYSQGLRADLLNTSVRVINVSPGPHDTRLAEGNPMDKPAPINVASKTIKALESGANHVFPDAFSEQMFQIFLDHPEHLEKTFIEAANA